MIGGAQLAKAMSEDEEIRLLVRDAMRLYGGKERRHVALEKLRGLDDGQASIAMGFAIPYQNLRWLYLGIWIALSFALMGVAFVKALPVGVQAIFRLSGSTLCMTGTMTSAIPVSRRARAVYTCLCRRSTLDQTLTFIYLRPPEVGDPVTNELWTEIRKVIEEMNKAGEAISPKAQKEIALRLKAYWPSLWMVKEARLAAQAMLDPAMADRLDKDSLSPLFGLMLEIPYDEAQKLLQQSIRAAFPKPS